MVQYKAPPALAMRLLHQRGWNVLKIHRNNLGEDAGSYERGERITLDEIKAARAAGYRRIVVAGQSFGGRVALEVASQAEPVFGVVAMAPGMEVVGNARVQAPTDRRLQRARAERVAVIFPKDDAFLHFPVRGPTAGPVLAQRGRPWLMVDETSAELNGHSGGTGGSFAFHFGQCLVDFLSAPTVPDGRFVCDRSAGSWPAARALLPMPPGDVRVITSGAQLPAGLGVLTGRWYGVLGETIVSWALVESGGSDLHVLYSYATSSGRGGGIYPARAEAGGVSIVFPTKTTLTVTPGAGGRLATTTVPAPKDTNFSIYGGQSGPVRGELLPVPD
jgi:hypothetical protein